MDNRRHAAHALVVIGLGAVNFFYLSDLLITATGEAVIVLGWKSLAAIAAANLVALLGVWRASRIPAVI